MTATEALERRIDELCEENERLRQQVASIIGRSFRTADKMDCLETENAKLREYVERKRYLQDFARLVCENSKLRELVRDMWEGYYDPRCEECHLKDTPTCADCPICAREASVIDRMRELGVEVVMDERRRS